MIAGQLEINLIANVARLATDMNTAKGHVSSAMKSIESSVSMAKIALGALGAGLSVVGLVRMAKSALDAADAMGDAAERAGMAVEKFSALAYAAKQSDVSLETLEQTTKKLSVAIAAAAAGDKKYVTLFDGLGTSVFDAGGKIKSTESVLLSLSDTFEKSTDGPVKVAAAVELLGKNGAAAIPFLNKGSDAINRFTQEARDLGKVMDSETAAAADKFNKDIEKLTNNSEGLARSLTSSIVPALNDVVSAMIQAKKDSGALMAAWVGLGGIGNMIFNDGLSQYGPVEERLAKTNEKMNELKKVLDDIKSSGGSAIAPLTAEMKRLTDLSGQLAAQMAIMRQQNGSGLDARDLRLRGASSTAAKTDLDPLKLGLGAATAGVDKYAAAAAAAKKYADELKALYNLLDNTGESVNEKFLEQYAMLNSEFAKGAMSVELYAARMGVLWEKTEMGQAQIKAIIEAEKENNAELEKSFALRRALEKAGEDAVVNFTQYADDLEFELKIMKLSNAERSIAIELRKLEKAGVPTNTSDVAAMEARIRKAVVAADIQRSALTAADAWRKAGADIANSLVKAFGEGGRAVADLVAVYSQGIAKQMELDKEFQEAKKAGVDDIAAIEEKYQIDRAKNALGTYGDMAGAAAGFFDKNSKGYEVLTRISQVFHAAELAMTIAELVPKAISAVLNQANGDPYTAFGRMAAMAAIVAGLGVAVGGGGGASANVSADRQRSIGTGSVLGDADAKSESIANALKILDKDTLIGNQHTADMRRSLMSIDASIGGLASLIVRSAGLTGADTDGLNLGTKQNLPAWAGWLTGSAGGGLGSILSGGLTNVVGAIFGALFGRSTRSLTDSGIQFNAQTAGQARQGVNASGYADVTTNNRSFFGLVRSSSSSTELSALSPEIRAQFTSVVNNIFETILSAARIFGSDTNYISQVLEAFQIDFSSISLKDLKGSEIEEALRAYFGKLGDDMAGAAFEGLAEFQKVGEGLLETLVRLSQEFAVTNEIARILGKDVSTAFGAVGFASIAARDNLVELFGGIDNLSESVQNYYDTFYTEEERLARTTASVAQQFSDLGIAMPANNAAFRDLVEAQDLSTEAGREMFASLVQLSPEFAAVTSGIDSLIDKIADLKQQAFQFTFGMIQRFNSAGGNFDAAGFAAGRAAEIRGTLPGITDPARRITAINNYVGTLDTWYQTRSNQIANDIGAQQAQAQAAAAAQNAIIQARISAMQTELQLAQQWSGLLEQTRQQIDSMRLTAANPLALSGRLGLSTDKTDELFAQFRTLTGSGQVDAATRLLPSLQQRLQLLQENSQRPSAEYQDGYNEIIAMLSEVEGVAQTESERALTLQQQIADLQAQGNVIAQTFSVENSAAMQELNQLYREQLVWAEATGREAYQQQEVLAQQQLDAITGGMDVGLYSAQVQADSLSVQTESLTQLRRIADAVVTSNGDVTVNVTVNPPTGANTNDIGNIVTNAIFKNVTQIKRALQNA